MCRLMFIIGAKESGKIKPFMEKAKVHLSKANTDGLGYTAINKDGSMFTERWLDNDESLGDMFTEDDKGMIEVLGEFLDADGSCSPYTQQGQVDSDFKNVTSVMLHTRFATCSKGIDNVHPFVSNDNEVSIIHNGVISNHKEYDKLNSTCDSEVILTEYMKRDIKDDVTKIEQLANDLKGYWAIGTTAKDSDGVRFVDIHRSNASATLFALYVKQLRAIVFATRVEILVNTMEDMGWEQHNTIFEVNPFVALRFDATTGRVMQSHTWENKPTVTKQEAPVYGHWDSTTGKWVREEEKKPTVTLVPDTKVSKHGRIVDSNFVLAYDNVYEYMDDNYEFVEGVEADADEELDEELLKLLSEVDGDLTKEENEEMYNLPYDMIPQFLEDIVNKRKEEANG